MGLRIVMLGAPGAGKGTQAKRMAEAYALPHISTGDIFRANLSQGTALGNQVKEYLDAGKLVPDELTCQIVADRLTDGDCVNGYILDGFPRSIPQAETFKNLLADRGEALDLAINIAVDDEEIVGRLAARRFCSKCGKIYNLKFDPPKDTSKCDDASCGGDLSQRSDDQEDTIRERLRVYHETTEPIIAFYDKEGVLKTVDGNGATPGQIFSKIESIVSAVDQV